MTERCDWCERTFLPNPSRPLQRFCCSACQKYWWRKYTQAGNKMRARQNGRRDRRKVKA